MEQSALTLPEIKKRVVKSFMSLTARQVALRAISFVTLNIILARVLPVETLGIFNIATSIVTFFAFFSDIGLAASLIQKKSAVTEEDVKTVFTIQQLLVGLLSIIIIIAAPWLGDFYKLDGSGVWLIRILGIGFFLSSLKVVPAVLLERELRFQPLVMVEIVETLVFNILLIIFVFQNFGLWAFSIAALARGVVGTILIYVLSPTRVGFAINKTAAKELLSFGIPFQANSMLAMLKDRLVPLVVAGMVGPMGVGFITWSQNLAFLPLEIMNVVIRITFPAFSRLQDNKEALAKAIEKSLFATTLLVFPAIFGLGAILPSLVHYVVSNKWEPALGSFYFFAGSIFLSTISTTFTNVLNAIGQIKTTLKLMVFWTVATWVLTPILVHFYGFLGVGISSFIISFTSIITIVLVKRVVELKVLDAVFLPFLASLVMGIVVFGFSYYFVRNQFSLIGAVALGVLVYSVLVLLFGKNKVLADLKSLKNG